MIKFLLLASTMIVAAPALAQTTAPTPPVTEGAPTTQPDATTPSQTAVPTSKPANPAAPSATAQPTDPQTTPGATNNGMTVQTDPTNGSSTGSTTTRDTTGGKPTGQTASNDANKADAVKAIVDQEWASYDADKDGSLNATEFGGWMVALKSKADPSTKAEDPATKTWAAGAFASADSDRSKSVSRSELTGFLSKG